MPNAECHTHCRLPIADCRFQGSEGTFGIALPTTGIAYAHNDFPFFHSAIGNRQSAIRAFTLVEVLVAIVIALLLIVGISKIFGLAQQASGMGTTLVKINDATRTIQAVFRSDFQNILTDPNSSPGFVIASYAIPAFRNVQDYQTGPDQTLPLTFPGLNVNSIGSSPFVQCFTTNFRIHRTDRMCFFESGQFQRQTGDPIPAGANLVSPGSSTEALVWIGHLALPNNPGIADWDPKQPDQPSGGGDFYAPGCATGSHNFVPGNTSPSGINDNNQFASQWILGRCVTLLAQAPPILTGAYFLDYPNTSGTTVPLSLLAPPSAPLSTTSQGCSAPGIPIYASRTDIMYDQPGRDPIATFHAITANLGSLTRSSDGNFWWEDLVGLAASKIGGNIGGTKVANQPFFANPLPTKNANFGTTPVSAAQWTSAAAAQTAPIFVRGCTQFIVEFAGDYATQDPATGQFKGAGPDGQIDFIVDQSNSDPSKWTRRIRWYGFPRDVASSAPNNQGMPGPPGADGSLDLFDVIPVKWYLGPSGTTLTAGAGWFEKSVPAQVGLGSASMPFTGSGNQPNLPGQISPAYICAWGPDVDPKWRPKLIRITMAIDEPTGRLNTEQTYEFIFALP